jgi:hypothetical protein
VTHRLDRPTATRTAETPATIEVREPPYQALSAFDIGKLIDHEFKREGIDADIFAYAPHLDDAPLISQKEMLLAVHTLQKSFSAPDLIQGYDGAEAGLSAIAYIG